MSTPETINVTLKVWRQNGPDDRGHFETIAVNDVETQSSFLEMLDFLNEKLIFFGFWLLTSFRPFFIFKSSNLLR